VANSASAEKLIIHDARRVRTLILASAALFLLNAVIVWPLFRVEFLRHLFSSDGTFIAIARYMLRYSGDFGWWPWWGTGLPFESTYVPGLPSAVTLVARLAGLSPGRAYHIVTAATYCLGPIAVFLLAHGLSRKVAPSFIAGLAYSLISPSTLLIPAIRADAGGFANPQRLRALVFYGGGPQVATLALVPLAMLFFHWALNRRTPLSWVLAGASGAAVALTNAFGLAYLGMAIACLLVGQALPSASLWRGLTCVAATACVAYLCVCRWLPPSLLRVTSRDAQMAGGDFHWTGRSALAIAIVLLLFVAAVLVSRYWREFHVRFFLLLSVLLAGITILGAQWDLNALPQPTRLHVEMEMPLCVLAAFAAERLWRGANGHARTAMVTLAVVLGAAQFLHYRSYARELILPPPDLPNTVEYRISHRMAELFGSQRVMVSGSPALFANVFTDVRQLAGAHDQFNANPALPAAGFLQYGGFHGNFLDGPRYVLWLKAFGAHGVNVAGPRSGDPYKPFRRNFQIFDGLLPVIERDGDDTIYRVPQRGDGLAHVVPLGAIVRQPPASGFDTAAVARYVTSMEDATLPVPSWQELDRNSAVVRSAVQAGQVVSVAMTYSPGWHATVGGKPQSTFADGLGMLVIEPHCSGPCEIQLHYDGGRERAVTRWLSLLAFLAVCGWLVITFIRRSTFGALPR
jgi:hypothetical protein